MISKHKEITFRHLLLLLSCKPLRLQLLHDKSMTNSEKNNAAVCSYPLLEQVVQILNDKIK